MSLADKGFFKPKYNAIITSYKIDNNSLITSNIYFIKIFFCYLNNIILTVDLALISIQIKKRSTHCIWLVCL